MRTQTLILSLAVAFALFAGNADAQPSRATVLTGHASIHVESPQYRHARGVEHRRYNHGRGQRHSYSRIAQVKHDKAHYYAQTAVQQAREARQLGYRSGHPRWSTHYREHYYWALDRHPDRLHRESRERAAELRQLRHYAYDKPYGYGH